MSYTLDQLNTASHEEACAMLAGLYEHTPWIAEQALQQRPFASLAALKHAMTLVLDEAGVDAKLALIRAHPELAGKAMQSNTLTAESTNEQSKAGLTNCTPDELAHIQSLNRQYLDKFNFPFVVAVRGPRGTGLSKAHIVATVERRLRNHPDFEREECVRNIHRIAEIRLNDKFGVTPTQGNLVWDWHEDLAQYSDPGYAQRGELTVTYLTPAHQQTAASIAATMRECGFDSVHIDAVGNVVGVYQAHQTTAHTQTLLTGSHYDTVRNAGKYDGRLGIYVPMACVRALHAQGKRLPFHLEVVGFAEEEGQRYKATFLGSGALVGQFDPSWLDQLDADGISMRQAMAQAGLNEADIANIKRDVSRYLGFVEVHIEQGPVLNELNLPLGVVTSINGSVRYLASITGTASHAGTTPMSRRRDAVAAFAEFASFVEQRAAQDGDSVATIGMLAVPSGSINVVPGQCQFSLDMRAPNDRQRDALHDDIVKALQTICAKRGVHYTLDLTVRASAAPSAPDWQTRWEAAVQSTGLPVFCLPSGAGHDAMKLHEAMPQAMLFVRGENAGISHNPLESTTSDDMQLCVDAFMHLLHQLDQVSQVRQVA
ncbi:MAG: 2-oxo-4-hydroxy-4-carboxy-5-ureidoimidazoline decarboxylase [Burkholderiaceae bacterium]|jgi:beta-ureidopropionase / N-carbamoyl-L-amino-acid hydrolase|nr:2-oxo-4-hydroxy-4-carboxy-5-ureidoimidazoline decarboxylase [Burkholderiaceae bacterium]